MVTVARYLKTHEVADNSTIYTPVFTDTSLHGNVGGSIGSWTPLFYGVHNPSADQDVVYWTVDQGTTGTGVTVHMIKGSTFYARIAKITVSGTVVLLGTANTPGIL
jgi:hypothetical protein